ncbi:MAG: hypothetical protein ACI81A_002131, partial [Paraglaciecola sp.]
VLKVGVGDQFKRNQFLASIQSLLNRLTALLLSLIKHVPYSTALLHNIFLAFETTIS